MHDVEMERVVSPMENTLPLKAKLLHEKFSNRSPEEQLRFFMNVVEQKAKLEAYEEIFGDIKEVSL